jgi:DNA-binding response OmpR family regulator
VVVRLELPDDGTGRRTPTANTESRDDRSGPALDPARLARAVEDLIRAIDPSLADARVEIEVTRVSPVATARPAPVLAAAGGSTGPPAGSERDEPDDDETDDGPAPRPAAAADLGLDLAGRTLAVDGRIVTLTRREFDLLAYLQDHRGVALGRQELMNTVWHSGYLVGDRTIDVHVRRLRIKLGRHADRLRTLRGFGYRLD